MSLRLAIVADSSAASTSFVMNTTKNVRMKR